MVRYFNGLDEKLSQFCKDFSKIQYGVNEGYTKSLTHTMHTFWFCQFFPDKIKKAFADTRTSILLLLVLIILVTVIFFQYGLVFSEGMGIQYKIAYFILSVIIPQVGALQSLPILFTTHFCSILNLAIFLSCLCGHHFRLGPPRPKLSGNGSDRPQRPA